MKSSYLCCVCTYTRMGDLDKADPEAVARFYERKNNAKRITKKIKKEKPYEYERIRANKVKNELREYIVRTRKLYNNIPMVLTIAERSSFEISYVGRHIPVPGLTVADDAE